MIRRIKTVSQEWDKSVSRCSWFVETHKIYLFGILIYNFTDNYKEEMKSEEKSNIVFKNFNLTPHESE